MHSDCNDSLSRNSKPLHVTQFYSSTLQSHPYFKDTDEGESFISYVPRSHESSNARKFMLPSQECSPVGANIKNHQVLKKIDICDIA